jgi:hypothetical protein
MGSDEGQAGAMSDLYGEIGAGGDGGRRLIWIGRSGDSGSRGRSLVWGSFRLETTLILAFFERGIGGPVASTTGDSGDIGIMGAIGYDMGDAPAHFAEVVIVPHDEGGAISRRENLRRSLGQVMMLTRGDNRRNLIAAKEVIEFALTFLYALGAAEAFEVGLAYVGNKAMGREGIPAISFDLLLVVGAHFDDGQLGVGMDGEDSEGDTNMIVEVALCGIAFIGGGENGVDEFFGGRFAVAARDRDKGDVELFSMMEGEVL